MSVNGHYNTQYFSSIEFPKQSFTIAGISYYQKNADNIQFDNKLIMKPEPNNIYDNSAIAIYYKDNKLGYVPNNKYYKILCNENIKNNLRIINIKSISGKKGIRVIPERFFEEDYIKNSHFVDN
jgi:spore germination protein YaaH